MPGPETRFADAGRPPAWLAWLACLALGLLAYANTLQAPPVFDDAWAFGERGLAEILADCRQPNRLLPNLTFALNFWLHGREVLGYHLLNLLIHASAAWVLMRLAWQGLSLTRPTLSPVNRQQGAWLAGLAFLLHPLATQAVTYITQRLTSLTALLYLLAVLGWVAARQAAGDEAPWRVPRARRYWVAATLAGVGALLSKEFAITLPALWLLVDWLWLDREDQLTGDCPWRWRLLAMLPLVLACLAFAWWHLHGREGLPEQASAASGTLDQVLPRWAEAALITRESYLATQLEVIPRIYLGLALWPWGQSIDHFVPLRPTLWAVAPLAWGAGLLALVGLALAGWRRWPLLATAILGFLVTLAPTSSLIPNTEVVAEHRAYLSLAWLGLGLAWLWSVTGRPGRSPWPRLLLAGLLLLVLTGLTVRRNAVWRDPLTLWTDAARQAPQAPRPWLAIGNLHESRGALDQAADSYRAALRISPNYAPALNSLGALALRAGQLEQAESLLRQAQTQAPDMADVWYNLGLLHGYRGEHPAARAHYTAAIDRRQHFLDAWYMLGLTDEELGDPEAALKAYHHCLRLAPHPLAALRVGILRQRAGDLAGAQTALSQATRWAPTLVPAWLALAQVALAQGQVATAVSAWEAAVRTPSSQQASIHLELARHWLAAGRLDAAQRHATAALRLGQALPPELRAALAARNLQLPPDP